MVLFMYSKIPNLVIDFHGCDELVSEKVLNHNENLLESKNDSPKIAILTVIRITKS
jgi:hypothetical protein